MSDHVAFFVLGFLAALALVALGSWIGDRLKLAGINAVALDSPQNRRFEERVNRAREITHDVSMEWQ